MPSPFPGMDPYLEKPTRWSGVHLELISGIRATLNGQLSARYYAEVQERVYVYSEDGADENDWVPDIYVSLQAAGGPSAITSAEGHRGEDAEPLALETFVDEEVREPFLEILDAENHQVVTVIEVLSPANKVTRSDGLESFRAKRRSIMKSRSHWVEIDLLRRGVSLALRKRIRRHEYMVHVSPSDRRPIGLVWPIPLSQRLPVIPIPLRPGDDDSPLDLQAVLNAAYDRARYGRVIDYTQEPVPPLSKQWKEWSDRLLREKGLRPEKKAAE
jgi:hypothetical protein